MFLDISVRCLQACEVFTCGSGNSISGRRVLATYDFDDEYDDDEYDDDDNDDDDDDDDDEDND